MQKISLRDRSILVTGGAGLLGDHLVDRVIAEGSALICVIHNFFVGSESNLALTKFNFPYLEIVRIVATDFIVKDTTVQSRKIDSSFKLVVVPRPTSLTNPSWGLPNHPIFQLKPRQGNVRKHCADVSVSRSMLPDIVPRQLYFSHLLETIDWPSGHSG